MEQERLVYASSGQQDTFRSQYMYQNVPPAQDALPTQNVMPLQNVAPVQSITPQQNTGQQISPPPVKQSPLNQFPIPQLHTQYQQSFDKVPPMYGHLEQTQHYKQPQQLPQTLPGFPTQQLSRAEPVHSPEKSGMLKPRQWGILFFSVFKDHVRVTKSFHVCLKDLTYAHIIMLLDTANEVQLEI